MTSVLAQPGDIYTPFSTLEVRRLQRYVDRVNQLRESSFFEHPGHRMKGTLVGVGVVQNLRVDSPGEEAVRAVVGLFRELYVDSNETSAKAVLGILDRHARLRRCALATQAREELRTFRDRLTNRKLKDPYGVYLEEEPSGSALVERPPSQIVDLWLNGEYLHYDLEKADQLGELEPATEMMRMTLHSAIRDYAREWSAIARFTAVALRELSLQPTPSSE